MPVLTALLSSIRFVSICSALISSTCVNGLLECWQTQYNYAVNKTDHVYTCNSELPLIVLFKKGGEFHLAVKERLKLVV